MCFLSTRKKGLGLNQTITGPFPFYLFLVEYSKKLLLNNFKDSATLTILFHHNNLVLERIPAVNWP